MIDPECLTAEHGGPAIRRIAMLNDLDLTRKILEAVRAREDLWPREVEITGYAPLVIARHVERLFDEELIEGTKFQGNSDQAATVKVRDLTSAGHNFLSALESGDTWARLKSALSPSELGALSMKKLAGIAGEVAEKAIRKKLGLE